MKSKEPSNRGAKPNEIASLLLTISCWELLPSRTTAPSVEHVISVRWNFRRKILLEPWNTFDRIELQIFPWNCSNCEILPVASVGIGIFPSNYRCCATFVLWIRLSWRQVDSFAVILIIVTTIVRAFEWIVSQRYFFFFASHLELKTNGENSEHSIPFFSALNSFSST